MAGSAFTAMACARNVPKITTGDFSLSDFTRLIRWRWPFESPCFGRSGKKSFSRVALSPFYSTGWSTYI